MWLKTNLAILWTGLTLNAAAAEGLPELKESTGKEIVKNIQYAPQRKSESALDLTEAYTKQMPESINKKGDITMLVFCEVKRRFEKQLWLSFSQGKHKSVILNWLWGKTFQFDKVTYIRATEYRWENDGYDDMVIDVIHRDSTTESYIIKENAGNLSLHKLVRDSHEKFVSIWDELLSRQNDAYLLERKRERLEHSMTYDKRDFDNRNFSIEKNWWNMVYTDFYCGTIEKEDTAPWLRREVKFEKLTIRKWDVEYKIFKERANEAITVVQWDKKLDSKEALQVMNLIF